MSQHVVPCSAPDCGKPASYKIAAPWTDGRFKELKNYGHACEEHLAPLFREAEDRRAQYKPAPGETVDQIRIYQYEPGKLDKQLQHRAELEQKCRS